MCEAWADYNCYCPDSNYGKEIILNNSHILINNTLFHLDLWNNGINYVKTFISNVGSAIQWIKLFKRICIYHLLSVSGLYMPFLILGRVTKT